MIASTLTFKLGQVMSKFYNIKFREITNYKDVNKEKNIDSYFADLSIYIVYIDTLKSESFYIKFLESHILIGKLQSWKYLIVVNTVIDHLFK